VTLADGTRLRLNTATAVDAALADRRRTITLRYGEIAVTPADRPRQAPLAVRTEDGAIRPVGTRFTVRRYPDEIRTTVAVLAGAVEISPARAAGRPVRVAADWQTTMSDAEVATPRALDGNALAWMEGMLGAERMRLGDFLREVDRHRLGVLRCHPAVAELRLTGAYPLRDTDRILASLEQTLPVRVRTLTRYWVVVGPRR